MFAHLSFFRLNPYVSYVLQVLMRPARGIILVLLIVLPHYVHMITNGLTDQIIPMTNKSHFLCKFYGLLADQSTKTKIVIHKLVVL